MATGRARAFWMAREQQVNGDAEGGAGAGDWDVASLDRPRPHPRTHPRTPALNGAERPAPWDAHAWAGLYCTLRDKRRARSRTPAATTATATAAPTARSLTPSSLTSSSGRTTPTASLSLSASLSPAHASLFRMASRSMSEEVLSACSDSSRNSCASRSPHRYRATCWLEPRPVPVLYSSTVYMTVGSTEKRFVEEVTFQTRLVPRRFSESMTAATIIPTRRFTSVLEIQCLTPAVHVISLDDHQLNGINGTKDEYDI